LNGPLTLKAQQNLYVRAKKNREWKNVTKRTRNANNQRMTKFNNNTQERRGGGDGNFKEAKFEHSY